ncbi:MAG: glycosyltransferase family 2 protein [Bacteroidales bacterium]|nr:glycosyltransferase family 2 protein [Bacteroidales bacterium]
MNISVIIPSFKPKEYLWECLHSLEVQSFPKENFEVLLVLNGCNEPYNGQIKTFLDTSNLNVNYIQTNTPGVSNARNIGLDEAKGDYICFIDDDDFVSPLYLEELYLKAKPDIVSLCRPLAFTDGKEDYHTYLITRDFDSNYSLGKIPFYRSKKFFSGSVYKLIYKDIICDRKFDTRFKNGEDSIFMFLISDRLKYVDFTSSNAIYYRRNREGSAVASRNQKSVVSNRCKMIFEYTKIFFSNLGKYRFIFYVSRLLASLRVIIRAR